MATEIRIATQYLRNIEERANEVVGDLQAYARLPGCEITSSPEVGKGYHQLEQRWDEKRGDLFEGLSAVIHAMRTIREGFENIDSEFAAKLAD